MICQEQQTDVLGATKSKESEKTFASTHVTSNNLTKYINPPTIQATTTSSSAAALHIQPATLNNNNEVVLNVKCHYQCGGGVLSESYGFHHFHHHISMNSACFYELPTKFTLLPKIISCAVKSNTIGVGNNSDTNEKQLYLADKKRCWPPPIFIIFISLLQLHLKVGNTKHLAQEVVH